MNESQQRVEAILRRAGEILQTARQGYEDLVANDKKRRLSGLRNLIVFGRSVTFVLQNLRSEIPEEFNRWYEPEQEKMKNDPLMRYFVVARNVLEKQGKLNISTEVSINSFSSGDLKKFGPPPIGAKSFFVGDQLGGTGWEVAMPDGSIEKYYVDFPAEIGEVRQRFSNFPEATNPALRGRSVEVLSDLFLIRLEKLLRSAREQFLSI